jgi:hypothetical protein
VAARMPGQADVSYKRIQRFLQDQDPLVALRLLFIVIGDPTELERPHAGKTKYVGTRIFTNLVCANVRTLVRIRENHP